MKISTGSTQSIDVNQDRLLKGTINTGTKLATDGYVTERISENTDEAIDEEDVANIFKRKYKIILLNSGVTDFAIENREEVLTEKNWYLTNSVNLSKYKFLNYIAPIMAATSEEDIPSEFMEFYSGANTDVANKIVDYIISESITDPYGYNILKEDYNYCVPLVSDFFTNETYIPNDNDSYFCFMTSSQDEIVDYVQAIYIDFINLINDAYSSSISSEKLLQLNKIKRFYFLGAFGITNDEDGKAIALPNVVTISKDDETSITRKSYVAFKVGDTELLSYLNSVEDKRIYNYLAYFAKNLSETFIQYVNGFAESSIYKNHFITPSILYAKSLAQIKSEIGITDKQNYYSILKYESTDDGMYQVTGFNSSNKVSAIYCYENSTKYEESDVIGLKFSAD